MFTLRDYQKQGVKNIVTHFEDNDRALITAACAAGKTIVALAVAEKMKSNLILFLAPTIALTEQSRSEWDSLNTVGMNTYTVSSAENGSTDISDLVEFLKGDGVRVVFSTYQSLQVVAGACEVTGLVFDLIVGDEAHKTAGAQEIASDPLFGRYLNDELLPRVKTLSMTATPRMTYDENSEVISMNNSELYGDIVWEFTYMEALQGGWVASFRVKVNVVEDSELIEATRQQVTDDSGGTVNEKLAESAIVDCVKDGSVSRLLTCHTMIADAERFSNAISRVLAAEGYKVYSAALNGHMGMSERQLHLNELSNPEWDVVIICHVDTISEGVSVDSVDSVCFVDAKTSPVYINQFAGRAYRLDANNPDKVARIILPATTEQENPDLWEIHDTNNRQIASILLAMSSMSIIQPELIDIIKKQNNGLELTENEKEIYDDSGFAGFFEGDLSIISRSFTSYVSYSDRAQMKFDICMKYFEQNGHWYPNSREMFMNLPIGNIFVSVRKGKYKELADLLQKVGFPMQKNRSHKVKAKTEMFQRYFEQNGHWQPKSGEMFEGEKIAQMFNHIRSAEKLSDVYMQCLEEIGFDFDTSTDKKVLDNIEMLERFYSKNISYNTVA